MSDNRNVRKKLSAEQRRTQMRIAKFGGVALIPVSVFFTWLLSNPWILVLIVPAVAGILIAHFYKIPDD